MKPIYKILIIVFIIVLIGAGIYFVWKLFTSPSVQQPPANNQRGIPLEEKLEEVLVRISDEPIFDFWIITDTKTIFYSTPEGKIFIAKDGKDEIISNQTINALNVAVLSPKQQKILASFGDPRQPQWGIFDLIDKIWRPLPAELVNVTWGENVDTLVGFTRSQNKVNLSLVDISKNPPQINTIIPNFNFYDVRLVWQNPNRLLIVEKLAGEYNGTIWSLNIKTKEIRSVFGPEPGLTGVWFDDVQTTLIFSVPNRFRIITPTSTLPFFQTLPEKCGINQKTVYCFVPADIPNNIRFPDDYLMKKFYSVDGFYSLNLENGQIRKLMTSGVEPLPAMDGLRPQYLDNSIYFINRFDGYLYQLKIK